jgi:nucleotide-binding universal stress UspA family protein
MMGGTTAEVSPLRIPTSSPVVVGVNGTAAGLAAVRLAAREAVSRGRMLRIVHAFTWAGEAGSEARAAAEDLLAEAVASAKRSTPGVRVDPQLLDGEPDRVLIQLSRTAELLVLGDDEPGGTPWRATASVLVQTTARAFCPVVVTRTPRPPSGPVLAAVDGSPWSLQALRLAAVEARRRGVTVEVAHVVSRAGYRAEDEGRAILAASVAAVPELGRFRSRLLTGAPGPALARASARARLLALGPRGTSGSALLGSVARELLHRGACPIVFVHGPAVPAQRLPERSSNALAG